jgi:uncharacterized membrane protein YtjA (UPF0391 family)
MKLNPFLKSLFTALCLLGGIYGLVTFGTETLFHIFVIMFVVLLTTSMVYGLFNDDYDKKY